MEIIVKENRELIIKNTENTQNENDVENIYLTVPEKYEDFNKKIVFVTEEGVKWGLVENNTYKIERSITKYEDVQIYVWLTKEDQDFRSVEESLHFNINHNVEGEITPEEKSSMEEAIEVLESEIVKVETMDIDAIKVENIATITITDKEGNQKVIHISDGENGTDGQDGRDGFSPTIRTIETTDGYDLEITDVSGTNTITISNGKDGKDGSDGLPGQAGADGISPTITETQTASGYDISITDKNGTRVISLVNGNDGRDGSDGAKGEKRRSRYSRSNREWYIKYIKNRYNWISRYIYYNIYRWNNNCIYCN